MYKDRQTDNTNLPFILRYQHLLKNVREQQMQADQKFMPFTETRINVHNLVKSTQFVKQLNTVLCTTFKLILEHFHQTACIKCKLTKLCIFEVCT